jgi:hypothetical protein
MHFCFDTVKNSSFKHKNRVMHFCFDTGNFCFDTESKLNSFIYKEIALG